MANEQPAQDVAAHLEAIADTVRLQLLTLAGQDVPFCIVVFTNPRASYIANVSKERVVRELRTMIGAIVGEH